MRATREDSGWNTDEPTPTSAAASSRSGYVHATDSSKSPDQREAHSRHERVRRRPSIRQESDDRLEQRCGQHQRQRHQADLREAQRE